MKKFAIILSSATIVGLAAYGVLEATNSLGLLAGNVMTIRIPVFVGVIAGIGVGSAALALVFRAGFEREERGLVRTLEDRLARLEQPRPPQA